MRAEFKMKTFFHKVNIRHLLVLIFVSFAEETIAATQVDLKHHFIGYLAVALTVIAYAIAMTEDLHQMSKAKPMVFGSALICLDIFVYYCVVYGTAKNVAVGFQSNS
jgi:heme/copper-type cytochrome/quinol oxidase subunit 4